MIIEIKGTGSHNKGAEMMLLTLLQEFKKENIKFAIAPKINSCEYSFYSLLGIYPKIWFTFKGIQFGKLGKYIPKKLRNLFGLVIDEEIDVILDASGFAYSSQWGNSPAQIMAKESKRWKKQGKKIILLPQAFGPFETDKIRKSMKEIIDNSALIYARDQYSYEELLNIKNDKKIKLCPDFTVFFKGKKPDYFNKSKHQVCIVPNQRMKDKTKNMQNYEDFFAKIICKLQDKNLSPFFLIHGGKEDRELAEKINALLNTKIEIISEDNPYFIKGIIEHSVGLIGSRFHSIASALYSGIPTLGTGWSHKYKHLFAEFNYEEGLISSNINDEELDLKLEYIIDSTKQREVQNLLTVNKTLIKMKVSSMFSEIKKEIVIK